jgi:hypothetical protein
MVVARDGFTDGPYGTEGNPSGVRGVRSVVIGPFE